jgi:hypothetical protein
MLSEQRQNLSVAFNTIIQRIFKLSRFTSVRNVIMYAGSKPSNILVDERHLLQLSCLKVIVECEVISYHTLLILCIYLLNIRYIFNLNCFYCKAPVLYIC